MTARARYVRLTKANFYRHIGAQIRRFRKSAGLSQTALGAKLNPPHSRQNVCNIERGAQNVNLELALQIAGALGVELAELVSWRKKR